MGSIYKIEPPGQEVVWPACVVYLKIRCQSQPNLIIAMNKWILLTHQIAQDAPNLRVKVWRHLKKLGAVLFKNAVYLLPYTKEHEESTQWICKQIRDSGSDASLFITESMDKKHNEEIIKTFQESCNKEYVPFTDQCNDVLKQIEQIEGTEGVTDRFVEDLKRKLSEIIKGADEVAKIYRSTLSASAQPLTPGLALLSTEDVGLSTEVVYADRRSHIRMEPFFSLGCSEWMDSQGVKVTSEYTQCHIAVITEFIFVAADGQSIRCDQGVYR